MLIVDTDSKMSLDEQYTTVDIIQLQDVSAQRSLSAAYKIKQSTSIFEIDENLPGDISYHKPFLIIHIAVTSKLTMHSLEL